MELVNTKDKLFVPYIITLVSALLILVTLFLPFVSASDSYEEFLIANEDRTFNRDSGMKAEDAINVSISEFGDAFAKDEDATTCTIFMVALVIFSLLAALFTFLKKNVLTIIFSILSFIPYLLYLFFANEYADVFNYDRYETGIAYYLLPIVIVVTIVGSICLIIMRKKAKNA